MVVSPSLQKLQTVPAAAPTHTRCAAAGFQRDSTEDPAALGTAFCLVNDAPTALFAQPLAGQLLNLTLLNMDTEVPSNASLSPRTRGDLSVGRSVFPRRNVPNSGTGCPSLS